jgi:hypothetical protein
LKDRLEKDEMTGKVERAKSPRGESFSQGGKEPLPRAISESFVYKGNAKVFGWKGAMREAQDIGNMKLDRDRGVKEEDLGFFSVDVHS